MESEVTVKFTVSTNNMSKLVDLLEDAKKLGVIEIVSVEDSTPKDVECRRKSKYDD